MKRSGEGIIYKRILMDHLPRKNVLLLLMGFWLCGGGWWSGWNCLLIIVSISYKSDQIWYDWVLGLNLSKIFTSWTSHKKYWNCCLTALEWQKKIHTQIVMRKFKKLFMLLLKISREPPKYRHSFEIPQSNINSSFATSQEPANDLYAAESLAMLLIE